MRNKAYALSANVIVFGNKNQKPAETSPAAAVDAKAAKGGTPAAAGAAAPAAAPTPAPAAVTDNDSERKVKTVYLATVFRCPPNIVNQ